jgi:hypothetical protein
LTQTLSTNQDIQIPLKRRWDYARALNAGEMLLKSVLTQGYTESWPQKRNP